MTQRATPSPTIPNTTVDTALLVLTLMLAGRAMTLAFIARAGGSAPTDPPIAWLLPLLGDAAIGLLALPVAYLVWKGSGLASWTLIVVWNALAIWDALSALVVHMTTPWPSFFMVEIFGSSMFFAASAMHLGCIWLATRPAFRERFLGATHAPAAATSPA